MISESDFAPLQARFLQNAGVPLETPAPAEKPKRRGRMNKLEARFNAEVIQPQVERGNYLWVGFEELKLRLADGAWYTVDFVILDCLGRWHALEVKGFWREAARVRIKVAAEKYPLKFQAVTRDRKTGEWKYEQFRGRE